jgi:hypothetical protein
MGSRSCFRVQGPQRRDLARRRQDLRRRVYGAVYGAPDPGRVHPRRCSTRRCFAAVLPGARLGNLVHAPALRLLARVLGRYRRNARRRRWSDPARRVVRRESRRRHFRRCEIDRDAAPARAKPPVAARSQRPSRRYRWQRAESDGRYSVRCPAARWHIPRSQN